MRKALFMINPSSGRQNIMSTVESIIGKLAMKEICNTAEVFYTKKKNDAKNRAAALKAGEYDFVVAVGGDGTLNEVAAGLYLSGSNIPMAVISAGTVNDFANYLNLPQEAGAFVEMIEKFQCKDVDLGRINDEYFINVVAGGMLTDIAYKVPKEKKATMGKMAYYTEFLLELPKQMTKNDLKLKVEDVQEKITDKTKAIILNSPCNPTGAVMDKEDIKGIAELAEDYDFLVISDEIYEKIIYGKKHYSPGAFSDNVITLNGFSKAYAMTGIRIGYINASERFNEELLKIHQYCTACANSIGQMGALEALRGPQDSVNNMVKEFEKRRNLIVKRLKEMGYTCSKPEGAFYVYPEVENPMEFVSKAAEAGVITVPGLPFGANGEKHIRMSYANSYENIAKAMDILEEV